MLYKYITTNTNTTKVCKFDSVERYTQFKYDQAGQDIMNDWVFSLSTQVSSNIKNNILLTVAYNTYNHYTFKTNNIVVPLL